MGQSSADSSRASGAGGRPDDAERLPRLPGRAARALSRRAFLTALAAGVPALVAACRAGAVAPTPPPAGPQPPLPTTVPAPPPTATAAVTDPATAVPSATPIDVVQVFHDGTFTTDPVSHDFNANPNCGGEPELWAGLLTFAPDLQPTPDWAQTWEVSAGGTRWTFHLQPDNQGWSNGDPVTAADFVWSWQRKLLPATGAADADLLFDIRNAAAVHAGSAPAAALGTTALDDWTLQVELTGPTPGFLDTVAMLGTVPAHRASVERYGAGWTEAGHCVSNGPFRLDSWVRGSNFQLSPNPGYWDAGALVLTGVDVPITAPESSLLLYRLDRLDQVDVVGSDLPGLQADPNLGLQLQQTVGNGVWALFPQPDVSPFDDPRVRAALAHAIDRTRLVQLVLGRALPASSLLPPAFPAHVGDAATTALQAFDVDAALGALAGTPYDGGHDWPPATMLMVHSDPDSDLLGRDVAAQLQENLGMTVSVAVVEPAAFTAALRDRRPGLVWWRSWFTSPDPAAAYGGLFTPAGAARPTTWHTTDVDALLASAAALTDTSRQLALYAQCERLLQQHVAYLPTVYPVTWYLLKPWVSGVPMDRAGYPWLVDQVFTRRRVPLRIIGRPAGPAS